MITVNSVAAAVFTILSSDVAIVSSSFLVELNPPLNADPSRMPWIGVLEGPTVSTPHTIGGMPWLNRYTIEVYVRAVSGLDGADLERQLSSSKILVLTAINSHKQLDVGGTNFWDMILGAKSEPYQRDLAGTNLIGTDLVTIIGEKRE